MDVIEQPKFLVDRFYDILNNKWKDLFASDSSFSTFDYNHLYFLLYGITPQVSYFAFSNTKKKDLELLFVNESLEDYNKLTKDYVDGIHANVSFEDFKKKLGCTLSCQERDAIYVTEYGFASFFFVRQRSLTLLSSIRILSDTDENAKKLIDYITPCVVPYEPITSEDKISYLWVTKTPQGGLTASRLTFEKEDIDINKNYNDDMPHKRIYELLSNKDKALILFNGKPGTGKTTYIKYLMSCFDGNIRYIDSSLLLNIDSSTLIKYFIDWNNSIVVLEDCEKLLMKRDKGNPFMGTLLNITDGIIGQTIKPKFICSFNCSESQIDEALLRKGRLSLKYTFNELALEKTKVLLPTATKPMTLADIYNHDVENIINKETEGKKVGF